MVKKTYPAFTGPGGFSPQHHKKEKKEGNVQLIRMKFTATFRHLLDGPLAVTGTASQEQSSLQVGKDHLKPKVIVFS